MHLLFIHQNFPAQFRYIAPRLVKDYGWRCSFLTAANNGKQLDGVEKLIYKSSRGATLANHFTTRHFENTTVEAHAVYEFLKSQPQLKPDLIVAHTGFGSSLFLPYLTDAPIINFMEYFYWPTGGDLGYRPELPVTEENLLRIKTKNAMLLLDLVNCTRAWTPTYYQREFFPPEFQSKIEVIFDGIDTRLYHRRENARQRLAVKLNLPATARVVTYVARGFEKMRGFDIFMRAAKRIYEQFPDVVFVVVGADTVHYGADLSHIKAKTVREQVLSEDNYDLTKFRFTGFVPEETLAEILSLTDLHIYLTEPFIASWSMVDAMGCGAVLLASDQKCVREYVTHGQNGLLCDFFDVEGLARQAIEVLRDRPAFQPLADAAMRTVAENYSVDVAVPRLKTFFENIATQRREPSVLLSKLVRIGQAGFTSSEEDLSLSEMTAGPPTTVIDEPASEAVCRQVVQQLLKDTEGCREAIDWVSACQRFRGPAPWFEQIGPWNHPVDLQRLLMRLKEWNARLLLDVGDRSGGRVFLWSRFATDQAKIVVAGLPGQTPLAHKMAFFNGLARAGQVIRCITTNESADAIWQKVQQQINGPKLDFVFLDGLRPVDEVRTDYNRYVKLVRPGGLLAIDGIGGTTAPAPSQDGGFQIWQQLRARIPKHAEYLSGTSMPRRGIGVVVIS